jgi:hypothetical protein
MVNRSTAFTKSAAVDRPDSKLEQPQNEPTHTNCLLSSGSRVRVSPGTLFHSCDIAEAGDQPAPRKPRKDTLSFPQNYFLPIDKHAAL